MSLMSRMSRTADWLLETVLLADDDNKVAYDAATLAQKRLIGALIAFFPLACIVLQAAVK
jgi:hypothetical protein